MLKNMKKVVIAKNETFEFLSGGLLIIIEVDRDRSIFRLKTRVFSEKSFIPFSIRECVDKILIKALNKKFPIYLSIDEKTNSVDLIQEFEGGVNIPLIKLVKLFVFAARSWASILKKIAGQDLLNQ